MRALISRRDRRERNGAPAVEAQERLARLTHIAELCAIFDAPAARHAGVGKFHVDAAALELFKHGAFPRSPNGRLPEATDVENRIAAQGISERLGAGVVRHEARAFQIRTIADDGTFVPARGIRAGRKGPAPEELATWRERVLVLIVPSRITAAGDQDLRYGEQRECVVSFPQGRGAIACLPRCRLANLLLARSVQAGRGSAG